MPIQTGSSSSSERDRSPTFAILPIAKVPDFLGRSKDEGHIAVVRAFRARIREINS